MRRSRGQEDVPPLLVVLVMAAAAVGYWLWTTPAAARAAMLSVLGYGPPPAALGDQLAWLLEHRLGELEGAAGLLFLAAAWGGMQGQARRETALLGGFGLRCQAAGRFLLLAWMAALPGALVVPVKLPAWPWWMAGLSVLVALALYLLARGRSRAY